MTAQRHDERSIFLEAIERRSTAERAAYLEHACGGDPQLRAEVEALLEAHQQSGDLLDAADVGESATMTLPPLEHPGTQIGPYKLLQQIGEGGMGVVFMAEQKEPLARRVALKIIKPGMDSRQVIARFEAERQALALMDHPNIAKVLDAGTTDAGRPFFVMELVHGVSITKYCDEHRLTPRERLELFVPVCQAVQHAHQKGIIHRDLKPSNVLVTRYDGQAAPKVIDFGVAKATGAALTERTLFTEFGAVVGTFEYMSPEQAETNQYDIDTRSDIYSLGVLLYELLTGTTPLERKRLKESALLEVLRLIREEDPPRPSTRLSTTEGLPSIAANRSSEPRKLSVLVRGELDWIAMKCLDKDRNRRYETASALATDVQRYLSDEPVQASPPSAAYRFRKFARRNKAAFTTAVLFAALLAIGTIVSSLLAIRAMKAERLAGTRLAAETSARARAVQAVGEGKHRLYEATLAQARASRRSGHAGQRFESWKAVTEAARLARELALGENHMMDLRNEAIACLALADVRLIKEWEGFPDGSSGQPRFDANLTVYARADVNGNISVRRVDDDRELARLPYEGREGSASSAIETSFAFSPNGQVLGIRFLAPLPGRRTNYVLWDWRLGNAILYPSFPVSYAGWSWDGQYVALAQPTGTITIHETANGKEVTQITLDFTSPKGVYFSPDGAQLAVMRWAPNEVQVREIATGKLLRKLPHPARSWGTAWSPDGALLATACDDKTVHVWNTATGRLHTVLGGHHSYLLNVSFLLDGHFLACASKDGTTWLWDLSARRELVRLVGRKVGGRNNSNRLSTRVGENVAIWEVASSAEFRTLPTTQSSRGYWGNTSGDGRWLAVGRYGGVQVWDLARGKELAVLPLRGATFPVFHPSRNELFTSSADGLYRWPLHLQSNSLRIGPPSKLPVADLALGRLHFDRDGHILAVSVGGASGGGRVLEIDDLPGKTPPLSHPHAVSAAISPHGRWAATGAANGNEVKVWDAYSGNFLKPLIPDGTGIRQVTFSPDGQWLLTETDTGYDLWKVESWEWARRISRKQSFASQITAAFSHDGKLMAIASSVSDVELLDPATGLLVARLESPDRTPILWLNFSADGGQLVVMNYEWITSVWDLSRIREPLREIGLDWDQPPYPPVPPLDDAGPVKVELDLGDLEQERLAQNHFTQGQKHTTAKKWQEAVAELSKAIELSPDHVLAYNNLAWLLATCPDPKFRDASRTVELAKKAVELAPNEVYLWNTLGAAHYRAGDWLAAKTALEKSMELRSGGDSFDWFFLAMVYWQLDNQQEARNWRDKAVAWMDSNANDNEELRRFRTEAEQLFEKESGSTDEESDKARTPE